MIQHSTAYLIEEGRRKAQVQHMATLRAARLAAEAAGTLPVHQPAPKSVKRRRIATRGGGVGLSERMQAVLDFFSDGLEHTVQEGAAALDMAEQSFSTRLRHLRREEFGSHKIERRYARSEGVQTTYFRLVLP